MYNLFCINGVQKRYDFIVSLQGVTYDIGIQDDLSSTLTVLLFSSSIMRSSCSKYDFRIHFPKNIQIKTSRYLDFESFSFVC